MLLIVKVKVGSHLGGLLAVEERRRVAGALLAWRMQSQCQQYDAITRTLVASCTLFHILLTVIKICD